MKTWLDFEGFSYTPALTSCKKATLRPVNHAL